MNRTPNFLIIGTTKKGTIALYHFLNQHPEVSRVKGIKQLEGLLDLQLNN